LQKLLLAQVRPVLHILWGPQQGAPFIPHGSHIPGSEPPAPPAPPAPPTPVVRPKHPKPTWQTPDGQQLAFAAPHGMQNPGATLVSQARLGPQLLFAQQNWFEPPQDEHPLF